jgi:hypothetical protein
MPTALVAIIVQALEIEMPWWKAPVLLLALLFGRIFFNVIMSFLFSGSARLRLKGDIIGGIPLSLVYGLVAVIILVLVMIDSPLQRSGLYLLVTGHLVGLLWSSVKSPLLQNISNTGSRFYAMSYLCTLELVLIFSFVN